MAAARWLHQLGSFRFLLAAIVMLCAGLVLLDRAFPVPLDRYRATSLELLDRHGQPIQALLSPDGMWRLPATPDDVSPDYLNLLLETEDRRFWLHGGVDPIALARASFQLATRGHIVSGGSTLTMQVARLLAPHRHTFKGKLLDIARALQLEAHYGKSDILSMYLTLAPFGGNIEGVRAAAQLYFRKAPSALTDEEAAIMVALPRSPTRLRPDRHPERLELAAATVLAKSGRPAPDPATWRNSFTRHPPPGGAPHLAERLAAQHLTGSIRTTLDLPIQDALVALARSQRATLDAHANLAMIVIDNRERTVLGYLGGIDYLAPAGMVDMVRAERSPGSTLKPLIYALAFDDTLVRPETIIDDQPTEIDGYAPRNFDRTFHGAVTVSEALQQSYNLPAVEMLRALGPPRFAAMLRQAGARLTLPAASAEAALPIALGGVGISLEDLCKLYVGLADGGRFGALRLTSADPQTPPIQLLTAASARQIATILRGTPLPDGVSPGRTRPVAYKTGTSYGFHDAWAVGYSPAYTVGIWVGRTDGTARPGAYGRNTAAPLLYQVFDALPEEEAAEPSGPTQGTQHLAPGLRHYRSGATSVSTHEDTPPKILFPPPGATLDATTGGGTSPVSLEATGGHPPYRWLVNGIPLDRSRTSTETWHPQGAGFARISVVDSRNESDSENVRVQ